MNMLFVELLLTNITDKQRQTLRKIDVQLVQSIGFTRSLSTLGKALMTLGFRWKKNISPRILIESHNIRDLSI
jgi:hypothetical protein